MQPRPFEIVHTSIEASISGRHPRYPGHSGGSHAWTHQLRHECETRRCWPEQSSCKKDTHARSVGLNGAELEAVRSADDCLCNCLRSRSCYSGCSIVCQTVRKVKFHRAKSKQCWLRRSMPLSTNNLTRPFHTLSNPSTRYKAKERTTYAFTAAPTFQLCCFRIFDAVFLSDCVTCVNSEIALFCVELKGPGIVAVRFGD